MCYNQDEKRILKNDTTDLDIRCISVIYIIISFIETLDTYLIFLFLLCHVVFLYSLLTDNGMKTCFITKRLIMEVV